jgi:hypothetical protein
MPAAAEYPVTTLSTLLDRAQIEDMLVDYYAKLGTGGGDFSAFYVDDAVLDVNNPAKAETIKAQRKIYEQLGLILKEETKV